MAVRRMQRDAAPASDDATGAAGAIACGAACGSLLAASNLRARPSTGALVGAGLWVATQVGCAPALGVVQPATLPPKRRNAIMLGAHLLWGAATALVVRTLLADGQEQP